MKPERTDKKRRKRRPSSAKKIRRRPISWIILLLMTVFLSLIYVSSRMESVKLRYRINHARKVHAKLQEENRRLQLEIAMLKSPRRIQRIASKRLGLTPLRLQQVIVIK